MWQGQLMLSGSMSASVGPGNRMQPLWVRLMLSTSMTMFGALTLFESAPVGTGVSTSGNFSLAHDSESSRGRLGLNLHHQRLVPGAAPPESKSSSKNAKRRGRTKVHTTRPICCVRRPRFEQLADILMPSAAVVVS